MRKIYLTFILAFFMAIVLCGTVSANSWEPDVDGSKMVWSQQESDGHFAVYVKNLKTGEIGKVKRSNDNQYSPAISGSRIVWTQKDSTGKTAIYIKNLATENSGKVKLSKNNQYNPDISGTRIVWTEKETNGLSAVYILNLKTGYSGKILSTKNQQYNPAISGTRTVWEEQDSTGKQAIYVKNMETGNSGKVKKSIEYQGHPDISGTRIVWTQQGIFGVSSVYVINLKTGKSGKVQPTLENQWDAAIFGTRIVWTQQKTGDISTAYIKNLATGNSGTVKKVAYNQFNPTISGKIVVWIEQDSSGNTAINMNLPQLNSLKVTSSDPEDKAENIPITKLIRINFSKFINSPDKLLVELKSSSGTVVPITVSIMNRAIFIDHAPLEQEETYTLTLKPDCVKDDTGNTLLSSYKTTFKTGNSNLDFTGYLIIPKLRISPVISQETLDAYNTVYHFSNSAYPGTPGECGLIGHRTTYSEQLRYINLLNTGDLVYIYDYTARKKITYRVVWNGDILWYVNPFLYNFKKNGESELIIMSCYPPGSGAHKWLCHCILESTVPL